MAARTTGMLRLRIVVPILAAAGTLALASAPPALGAVRWAEPGGDGPSATCPQADPCNLDTAVENVAVNDGDEVIVTPGTYSVVEIDISDAIELHGQDLQPRPTINTTAVLGIYVADAALVRDLVVEATGSSAIALASAGATIERLRAHASAGGGSACSALNSGTIRDSVCWQSGTNSRGVGANLSTFPGEYDLRLRNVTAVGTAHGIGFDYSGPGVDLSVDAKSVIADGGAQDVRASAADGASIEIALDHSNYASEIEVVGGAGVSATVTDPGTGSNQTAAPAFVDATTGDFHEQPGSPTIDAGDLDGFSGALDVDGNARTLDGDGICPPAPDIGAHERIGAPIDCDPPETTITAGPSGSTADSTPSFEFDSDEPGSSFECRVDGGAFAACTSPLTTDALADGPHALEVRAADPSGNVDPTPASRAFSVDTDPPETTITAGPSGSTADSTPSFEFDSDEPGSSFECRVDGGAFAACTSPLTTDALADGPHALEVRAADPSGNVDPTPASRAFSVDTDPPETTITAGPSGSTADSTPSFEFDSDEPGSSFECRVDGGAFAACTSPRTTTQLGAGPHVFAARAIDALGNTDPTPATRSFRVEASGPAGDRDPPETTIIKGPKRKLKTRRKKARVTVEFSSEAGASFECALDDAAFASCTSPLTRKVGKGKHRVSVRATDPAGNTDPTPASRSFKVKRKRRR